MDVADLDAAWDEFQVRRNEAKRRLEIAAKSDGLTTEQAAVEYFARFDLPNQAAPSETTAKQVGASQVKAQPDKEAKEKRFLGLRIRYIVVALFLTILIIVFSLLLSPDWARSNLTLVTDYAKLGEQFFDC